jgi:hypothetical protein
VITYYSFPEVGDLYITFVTDQNVLWGNVAMHNPEGLARNLIRFRVRIMKSTRGTGCDMQSHGQGQTGLRRFAGGQERTQVSAIHMLHDQSIGTVDFGEVINLDDIIVLKTLTDMRFIAKHFDEFTILRVMRQDAFHGDDFLKGSLTHGYAKINLGHPASGNSSA